MSPGEWVDPLNDDRRAAGSRRHAVNALILLARATLLGFRRSHVDAGALDRADAPAAVVPSAQRVGQSNSSPPDRLAKWSRSTCRWPRPSAPCIDHDFGPAVDRPLTELRRWRMRSALPAGVRNRPRPGLASALGCRRATTAHAGAGGTGGATRPAATTRPSSTRAGGIPRPVRPHPLAWCPRQERRRRFLFDTARATADALRVPCCVVLMRAAGIPRAWSPVTPAASATASAATGWCGVRTRTWSRGLRQAAAGCAGTDRRGVA